MSNLEGDRSVSTGKMYPIDLAPQKITIVKSVSNAEVKMAHLMPGQSKTTGTGQILTHAGPVGLMRPAAQIISSGTASQPQMIVSGSPILQGTQIVSQGSQLIGAGTQIISQSQLLGPNSQIISPATQIISQGTQLSVSGTNNTSNLQVSVASTIAGTQVLNVGGQLVSGTGNLVVSSAVRTLTPSVRVLPPLPHHNTRPVLSSVNVSNASGVLVNKSVTSHVPRGLAAGASLAVRQPTPASATQPVGSQGGTWAGNSRGPRAALVYSARAPLPRAAPPRAALAPAPPASHSAPAQPTPTTQPAPPVQAPHSAIVTLPTTTVLASGGVISSGTVRGPTPRVTTPTPTTVHTAARPLPLLQRNYQPTKVLSVASVGVRGPVGNSAPAQLYYEVPRPAPPQAAHTAHTTHTAHTAHTTHTAHTAHAAHTAHTAHALTTHQHQTVPRPVTPYAHAQPPAQVSVVNAVQTLPESRPPSSSVATTPVLPRPSILRKREVDGIQCKTSGVGPPVYPRGTGWEDVPAGGAAATRGSDGGSTTISASSSPPPEDEPEPAPEPEPPRQDDLSPRKKPRKQTLSSEVRQCEFQNEEAPPTPPVPTVNAPPKRPLLSSSYVCGWRATALHFARPADVRRREPRARDILAIANQRHVLASADGWKVHHLTSQMDDLVSLEADVGEQLAGLLRTLETASSRANSALHSHSHTLLELLKGNIQRSRIMCEGVQEAREDILRVFKHRNFVSDILTRQADKRCFRKHRSQS